MSRDVARNQRASKAKIRAIQKAESAPGSPAGAPFRNTPAGRRLAALSAKRLAADDQDR